MIYYLRRLNSHTAVAETFNIRVTPTSEIECGSICSISNGILTQQRNSSRPDYLALEDKRSGDGKLVVSCVRLAPGMVVKTDVYDDISLYLIGDTCSFVANNEEITCSVQHTGNDAEVIDNDGTYVTLILN